MKKALGRSYWRVQLGALGLDDEAVLWPEARREAEAFGVLSLPPLPLSERPPARARRVPVAVGAVVCVSLVSLLLLMPRWSQGELPRGKGGGDAEVWWQRGERTEVLREGQKLQAGDRVRVEVAMPTAGFAYWLVADEHGRMLVDRRFVENDVLQLKAGERRAFSASVQLDADAVGETLIVLLCSGQPLTQLQLDSIAPGKERAWSVGALPSVCSERRFGLR